MSKLYGTLSETVVEIRAANFGVAPPLLLGNHERRTRVSQCLAVTTALADEQPARLVIGRMFLPQPERAALLANRLFATDFLTQRFHCCLHVPS